MSFIRGRRADHLDQAGVDHAAGERPEAVVGEVLDEGLLHAERSGPDALGEGLLAVVQPVAAEQTGQPAPSFDLDEQHVQAQRRRRQAEAHGEGRLPDASLAGDDVHGGGSEECRWVHGRALGANGGAVPQRSPRLWPCSAGLGCWMRATTQTIDPRAAGGPRRHHGRTPRFVGSRPPPAGARSEAEETSPGAAGTGDQPPGTTSLVEVVEVSGLFDPILVDFVRGRIDEANERGLTALVLRLNSPGSVQEEIIDLARLMKDSPVPVAVWVGPSSAEAHGASAQLVAVARPGRTPVLRWARRAGAAPRGVRGAVRRCREPGPGHVRSLKRHAAGAGLVGAATLGDFIINLEGVATKSVEVDGVTRREPATTVRFVQLPLTKELMHTVASPSVAYLLFVIGVGLIVFELFTAGIGIAGIVGAAFVVLGSLASPCCPPAGGRWRCCCCRSRCSASTCRRGCRGTPRWPAWCCSCSARSRSTRASSLSWVTVVDAVVLLLVAYLRGMPAMVRSRFSAVDLGRNKLRVGEEGTVTSDVAEGHRRRSGCAMAGHHRRRTADGGRSRDGRRGERSHSGGVSCHRVTVTLVNRRSPWTCHPSPQSLSCRD